MSVSSFYSDTNLSGIDSPKEDASVELEPISTVRNTRRAQKRPSIIRNNEEGGSARGRDVSQISIAFSVATLGSTMTDGAHKRAREDLRDEGTSSSADRSKKDAKPWFLYRLIMAGIAAVFVCTTTFMVSCQSFRYESWDDGIIYYGIRGVTDKTTGACVNWQIQDIIDWSENWTNVRLPRLYVIGILGVAFVVFIAVAWVSYGVILKSKRNSRRVRVDPTPEDSVCGGPIGPAVIIGVCLIGAGIVMFVTIMGNCSNIPPRGFDRGLRCNLDTWSALALAASVTLCSMGGLLAFFLKCCCRGCFCTVYLREQLVES